jgi:hypothetical protein
MMRKINEILPFIDGACGKDWDFSYGWGCCIEDTRAKGKIFVINVYLRGYQFGVDSTIKPLPFLKSKNWGLKCFTIDASNDSFMKLDAQFLVDSKTKKQIERAAKQ